MKKSKTAVFTSTLVLMAMFTISCKDGNKKNMTPASDETYQKDENNTESTANGQQNAMAIVDQYLSIKEGLVADNGKKAAEAGDKLVAVINDYQTKIYSGPDKEKLQDIIKNAKKQAEQIAEGPIEKQREYFKVLSKNMTDMVAIIGTDTTLFEQFCPMYDDGSAWLSMNEEVRNPYYGSTMLKCGKVQRVIN
ncbi:MAG: DUF3347 domain-containing protein [Pricia sp.]